MRQRDVRDACVTRDRVLFACDRTRAEPPIDLVARAIGRAARAPWRRARRKTEARLHFVLDIVFFSTIIYMQYERGGLRPRLVIPRGRLDN